MSVLEVTLTGGEVALIDEESFPLVSGKRWHAMYRYNGKVYAIAVCKDAETGRWRTTLMHRLIAGAASHEIVDHINHDGLDNRRANLRVCSRSQNGANRNLATRKSKTVFIGVQARNGRYRARVRLHGRDIHIGTYDTPEEAAHARDAAALEHFGPFAALNFPA